MNQKVEVLRAKKKLNNSSEFKNVYLRSSKNPVYIERILELNAKTLLSQIPNGNGRIVTKDNSNAQSTAANSDG